jgi:hypothetical protein
MKRRRMIVRRLMRRRAELENRKRRTWIGRLAKGPRERDPLSALIGLFT